MMLCREKGNGQRGSSMIAACGAFRGTGVAVHGWVQARGCVHFHACGLSIQTHPDGHSYSPTHSTPSCTACTPEALRAHLAAGIYVRELLEAVPLDKYFELYKPGTGADGGFIRVSVNFLQADQLPAGVRGSMQGASSSSRCDC